MEQILYVSTAARDLSDAALADILEAARRRNAAHGVTGMLLYADRNFLQVLEGEATDVAAIFTSIAKDTRHIGVTTLLRHEIDARNFKDWSMGFKRIKPGQRADIDDVFKIDRTAVQRRLTESETTKAMTLLRTFYSVTTRDNL